VQSKEPGLKVSDDGKSITVIREVDGGIATVECQLPAIVTTDLRLNEPRYASLPGIMKAKNKPCKTLTPAELGVDVTPRIQIVKLSPPPPRKAGIKVPDVATLIDKLKNPRRGCR
jgi:electron transfer flavoprotein beta subunit